MLALGAEVLLGVLLVWRHRGSRLIALFAATLLALGLLDPGSGVTHSPQGLLLIGGSLAAVGGPRLLAPGPALLAARRVAASWWLAPAGRLAGALLLATPILLLGAVLQTPPEGTAAVLRLAAIALIQAAALGGVAAALAPLTGATTAGVVGLGLAWLGGVPPSGIEELLGSWPYGQRAAVLAWNVLPLGWRGARWVTAGTAGDLVLLVGWVAAGIGLAAWAVARPRQGAAVPGGTA
jgi:hypothetical protein